MLVLLFFLFLSIKPQNNKNVIKHVNRHLQLSQLTFTVKPIDTYYLVIIANNKYTNKKIITE